MALMRSTAVLTGRKTQRLSLNTCAKTGASNGFKGWQFRTNEPQRGRISVENGRYRLAKHSAATERGGGNVTPASQTEPCSSAAAATTEGQASGNGNAWTKTPFQNKTAAQHCVPSSYLWWSAVPWSRLSEETLDPESS